MMPKEKMKMSIELMKVDAAKMQMQLDMLEHEEKIDMLKKSIEAQDLRINELKEKIGE
jgi:hypothetical protein